MKSFVLVIVFLSFEANARVFLMGREKLGAYLLYGGASPVMTTDPFEKESSATQFSSQYSTAYLTDFGMLYVASYISLRFGFEIMKAKDLDDVQAKNAGGTVLYKFNNAINMFGYKGGLDLNIYTGELGRVYLYGYGGAVSLTMSTDYHSVTISPNVRHQVDSKGTGTLAGGGLGLEYLMFDTTTFTLEMGYRQLKFDSLTYTTAVTTFTGAKVVGDPVEDTDGNKRVIRATGFYVAAGMRVYMF